MTDNPYAPPKAAVSEVLLEPPATRPRQVLRAVWLLASTYPIWFLIEGIYWRSLFADRSPLPTLGSQIVGLAVAVWLYGKILDGRNWARVLVLVGIVLTYASFAGGMALAGSYVYPWPAKLAALLNCPIRLWACWLLFTSPGKDWFKKRAR